MISSRVTQENSGIKRNYALSESRITREVYKQSIGSNKKMLDHFEFVPTTTMESGLQRILDFQKGT